MALATHSELSKQPAKRGPKTGPQTKRKLLNVAEKLFAEEGIETVSLRRIMDVAGVGLSQLNYHFGTKKDLLRATCERKLTVMNEKRLAMLEEAELQPKDEKFLERLIKAYMLPVLEMYAKGGNDRNFVIITARLSAGTSQMTAELASELLNKFQQRFASAFLRAVPGLPEVSVFWRIHVMLSLLSHTVANPERIKTLSHGLCDPKDVDAMMEELLPVLIAGFGANATKPKPSRKPAVSKARKPVAE
ncbi:MAG: TetR family transcriptional regulator [Rhizobiaceae bacterium]|nr:TetR family transcriptional regulator [Rhizobiaceae bacterium]